MNLSIYTATLSHRYRSRLVHWLLLGCLGLSVGPLHADPASPAAVGAPAQNTTPPPSYLITWGDQRQRLEEEGVELHADLTWEGLQVVRGGRRQGHHSDWQAYLAAFFDMGRLLGWEGSQLRLSVNNRRGHSATDDLVGSMLPAQNVYGGEFWRLSELSFRQLLDGNKIVLKLGFMSMGDDFGRQAIGCLFISSTFCAHPQSMSRNSGWFNNPIARWGLDYQQLLRHNWTLSAGVFQVNPRYSNRYSDRSKGFNLFTGGNTGVILPVETEWTPGERRALPGHYKLGAYYDTSRVLRADHRRSTTGRYGAYLLVDQTLYHERAEPKRGLRAFAQWMYSDSATALIAHWYGAGLVYQGFFNRSNDTLSLGYVRATLNRHNLKTLPAPIREHPPFGMAESVIEFTYGARLTPWLLVMPDVQYLIHPGVFSYKHYSNALLFGLQTRLRL